MSVYLAAANVEEPDRDRVPLSEALEEAGIDFLWPDWEDGTVDWSALRYLDRLRQALDEIVDTRRPNRISAS